MVVRVNYLSVLLSAVAFMFVGMFWYSPLAFGSLWVELGHFDVSSLHPRSWHYA
jgi:hypothetical protein